MQNVNTFPVKNGAVYFMIVWSNGGNIPTFTGVNVQVIDGGTFRTELSSGFHRYIVVIKALEDGTVVVNAGSVFRGCEVYEVAIE